MWFVDSSCARAGGNVTRARAINSPNSFPLIALELILLLLLLLLYLLCRHVHPSRPTSRTLSITLNKHTTEDPPLIWWRGESDSKRHDISARIQFRTHLFVMRGENPFCQSAQAPPAAASEYILCCCRRWWVLCPENCHWNNKTTPSLLLHIFTAPSALEGTQEGFEDTFRVLWSGLYPI